MGNNIQKSDPKISNAINDSYIINVMRGLKQDIASKANMQIEVISNYNKYDEWSKNIQNEKLKIERLFPDRFQSILLHFFLPLSSKYQPYYDLCGGKEGKVCCSYQNGMITLELAKNIKLKENTPFSVVELWNLLLKLIEFNLQVKRIIPALEISPQNIYIDMSVQMIKLRTPLSFFAMPETPSNHQHTDKQKSQLLNRKLKIPQQVQRRNDNFNIGMIMAQTLLLEGSCLASEDALTHKKAIDPKMHQQLIERILKISYYPLKLKMIVVGMIQPESVYRFTSEELYMLLKDHKTKIHLFQNFHLRKTSFVNIFGEKLRAFQEVKQKIRHQNKVFIYRQGLPIKQQKKHLIDLPNLKNTQSKQKQYNNSIPNKLDMSLNFSLTNLGHTNNHHYDNFSLKLSGSDQKSSVQQVGDTPRGPLNMTSPTKYYPIQQQTYTQNKQISNIFKQFQQQKKKNQVDRILQFPPKQTPKKSSIQAERQRISSCSLKVQEEGSSAPLKYIIDQQHLSPSQFEAIENEQKIKIQPLNSVQPQQQEISHISSKKKTPSQSDESHSSSVVQYVNQMEPSQVKQSNFKLSISQKELSESIKGQQPIQQIKASTQKCLFETFEPFGRKKFIRKTQSYEIQPDHKQFVPNQSKITHQNSIIDKITALANSKKLLQGQQSKEQLIDQNAKKKETSNNYKQDKLTETAKKRMSYLQTLKKFSPQSIAQLNLSSKYGQDERLKQSMREIMSKNNFLLGLSKKSFPEQENGQPKDIREIQSRIQIKLENGFQNI